MKIRFSIIFFLLCFLTSIMFAQQTGLWYAAPFHPVKPQIGQPRILADTVFTKHTQILTSGENSGTSTAIIERSKDGLRDTFYYTHPYTNEIIVREYDTDNRLISTYRVRRPDDPFISPEIEKILLYEYKYDSSGRLTSLAWWSLPGIFENYDYSTIVYTDSSYILNQIEYVFNAEDQLIRAGGLAYTYFKDGYTEIQGSFEKMSYYFQENGYQSQKLFFQKSLEDEEWYLQTTWETTYRYKDDNPHNPSGNAVIETPTRKVYGVDGAVVIQSDKPETVQIYTISGAMIRNIQTGTGSQSIALPKGFYIVRTDDQVYKVMVR